MPEVEDEFLARSCCRLSIARRFLGWQGQVERLLGGLFLKVERCGIDAITQACGLGAIGEYVTQVTAARFAMSFGTGHSVTGIDSCTDVL